MMVSTTPTIDDAAVHQIGSVLNNTRRPLKERFRALFTLRNINTPLAIDEICRSFGDESALLKHESAYCLGQMQNPVAIAPLTAVLADERQEPMVRHEAAEALGAIGSAEVRETLHKYLTDPCVEVRETCEIALARVDWLQAQAADKADADAATDDNPFASVDPSPPAATRNVAELRRILLDDNETLFERYRAMFALRNIRTEEAVVAISAGLKCGSALFRHEIAFVLGQLQEPCSVPFLADSLRDASESEMVRHECAEALGAIATDECTELLTEYLADHKRVVKESCEVALDMSEYENSEEFQYANALSTLADNKKEVESTD